MSRGVRAALLGLGLLLWGEVLVMRERAPRLSFKGGMRVDPRAADDVVCWRNQSVEQCDAPKTIEESLRRRGEMQ